MKGVRELPTALQAYVRVQGRFYSQCFPKGTALQILKEWREDKRVAVRTGATIPSVDPELPTFVDDARAYLALKASMPTFKDREQHIREWAAHFGRRPRTTITAPMIQARLEQWRASGLSPSSVNKRRTALMDLWTRLDGKSARNPVRDVPKQREPGWRPRALSHVTIYRILACMSPSKTRTRLRVMAWTGWPHKQLAQIRPEHLKLKQGRAFVTPRRKGAGVPGVWLPLLPGAIVALKAFHTDDCYCEPDAPFSHSAMYHSFRRALDKLNAHRARLRLPPITARPYDLRHSFGTLLALQTGDDRVVQTMMLHSSAEQSRHYTEQATTPRVDAAIARLGGVATSATSEGLSRVVMGLRRKGERRRKSPK